MRPATRMVVLGKKLWTPANISPALWLDAADTSTITLNGTTVSEWRDKSGNARHASQATVANQPTYSATGFNNTGALLFNNTSNWMQSTTDALGTVTTFNAVALWQTNTNDNTFDYLYQVGTTSNALSLSVAGTGASVFAGNYYHLDSANPPTAFNSGTTALFSQPVITSHSINPSSPTNALFVNGVQRTVNSWTKTLNSTGTVFLGVNNQNGNLVHFLNGLIGGIIFVINTQLSTENRQRAEGFLAHRHQVTSILPNDHPFKFTPPMV